MPSSQRVSQFLLVSGRPEIIQRCQRAEPRRSATSSIRIEPMIVATLEAALRTLQLAAENEAHIRLVVVDSTWLAEPGVDIAARLWARHNDLFVVDCSSESCHETIDLQLSTCIQPRRFAVLRTPFAETEALLLFQNLIRTSIRDSQFVTSSQTVESLQERVEQLESENSMLTSQVRRHVLGVAQGEAAAGQRSSRVTTASVTNSKPGPVVRRTFVPAETVSISEPASSTTEAAEPSDNSPFNGRFLVADDHPASLRLVRFLLERAGIDVVSCLDGEHALSLYEESTTGEAFDVIILDILMPGMNGIECARHLRDRGYGGPILAVTGRCHDDADGVEEGLFNDWISKPLDRNHFVSRMREMVAAEAESSVS